MSLKVRLQTQKSRVAVWGTGFIGLSTMAYFARRGIKCIGYDLAPQIVEEINNGKITLTGLQQWLGFSIGPLVKNGLMHATTNVSEILDDPATKVHFIAIPTERNGKPWDGALFDVSKKLSAKKVENGPDLVVVESTLAPGQCDNILVDTLKKSGRQVPRDFLVAVAPRRDWFDNPGLNLNTIPRVVGGIDEESTKEATSVASIVCSKIVQVSSHRVAELERADQCCSHEMELPSTLSWDRHWGLLHTSSSTIPC